MDRTGWLKLAKRIAIAVAGSLVLVAGVAMIVLPGPAILVIPAGLAVLATEFSWARTLRDRFIARVRTTLGRRAPTLS